MIVEEHKMAHGGVHVVVRRDDGEEIADISVRRIISSLVNEERYEVTTSFRYEREKMEPGVRQKSIGNIECAVLQVPTVREQDPSHAQ